MEIKKKKNTTFFLYFFLFKRIKSKFSRELNSKREVDIEAHYGTSKTVGKKPET